jgi:hypothetical protein
MTQAPPTNTPPPKDNVLRYLLLGCLGIFLVGFLAVVIGGWYVASHFKQVASNVGRGFAVKIIEESNLPADQKKGITAHIDRVMEDYKAGKISDDQLGQIMEQIVKSPVLVVGIVYAAQEKYVKTSGLSAEEKTAAERTLQRLGRGAYEKKIPEDVFKKIMQPMMTTDANGKEQLKEKVTDDELRQTLALAKAEADKAGVPDEPYMIDISAEIGKAIERGLHPPALTQPATPVTQPGDVEVESQG